MRGAIALLAVALIAAAPAPNTSIIVDKSDCTLWPMSGTHVVRTYTDVRLGRRADWPQAV